ncbi:MAG: Ig-like domain-containing protein, partial [Solobacterium sp.]|nr:Ig-like domain-containing protein [Solobacterium sp.]
AATCEEAGKTVYTATAAFGGKEYTDTKEESIAALGHNYGTPTYEWSEDNSTVTATRICANDATHVETETANTTSAVTKAATCEEKGETTYTAEFENQAFTTQTKAVNNIEALGHNYGAPTYEWSEDNSTVTATRICANDASHVETETVNTTSAVTKAATCEEKGETTYTAEFENQAFTLQTKAVENIEALGHDYELTGWTWTEYSEAEATFTCKNDTSHVETVSGTITSATTEATCEEAGKTVYTATATFGGKEYTDTKEESIEALGHNYGAPTYEWSEDNSSVTAKRICANDATHVETETANTTSAVTKEATCEETGETTYTAEFENQAFTTQTKAVNNIEALGHDWDEGIVIKEPTRTEKGEIKYTCHHDPTHTKIEEIPELPPVLVTGVQLNTTEVTVKRGGTVEFTATVLPEDAENKKVYWTSSDTSVATVDDRGLVRAVEIGTAEITVTTEDGSYTDTAVVTVNLPLESISLDKQEFTLLKGETETLTVTFTPEDTSDDKTITWTSNKPAVATVNDGIVTAVGVGRATITAKVGDLEAECKLTVQFSDVTDPELFYYDYVIDMAERGIVGGYLDGTFRPMSDCTRAAVVTFLWRLDGKPEPSNMATFSDMTGNSDFDKAISWAQEQGITTGWEDGTFRPWNTCHRAAIMTFLWRYAGKPETEISNSFSDMTGNPDFDKAISWGVTNGITTGWDDGTFRPWNTCNRLAIVSFLARYDALGNN